jgi:hypothetical protein
MGSSSNRLLDALLGLVSNRSCAFNIRLMTMTASYEAWLEEVEQALASINRPMEEWQRPWAFDFPREFRPAQ